MPLHRHRRAYVSLVLAGGYVEYSVDGRFIVEAGDIVFHPPFHAHGDLFARDNAQVLGVELDDELIPQASYGVRGARRLVAEIRRRPADAAALIRDRFAAGGAPLKRARRPSRIADAAERWRAGDSLSVRAAAERAGVTGEYFARLFKSHFGVAPAAYRSEHRFRHAARAVLAGQGLAATAAQCGYADQSHMTREFNRFAGAAPGALAAGA